jgi:hypothetical protein
MVTINEPGREEPPKIFGEVEEAEEEEGHDGWGPIRPRRSSMPPDHPDAHEREMNREMNTMICRPKKEKD